MELVSSRNIEELVFVLKQEITKTHNVTEHDDTGKYRQLLVRTLHTCSIKVGTDLFMPPILYRFSHLIFHAIHSSINVLVFLISTLAPIHSTQNFPDEEVSTYCNLRERRIDCVFTRVSRSVMHDR